MCTMPTPPKKKLPLEILNVLTSDALFGAAMRLMRSRAAAEDLVQDTAIRAISGVRRGLFKPGTNATAWVFTILRNKGLNTISVNKNRTKNVAAAGAAYVSGYVCLDDALGQEQEHHQRSAMVRESFDDLPTLLREVVELRYIGGLTQRETSAVVGRCWQTVGTQAKKGLDRVRVDIFGDASESHHASRRLHDMLGPAGRDRAQRSAS